MTERTVYTSSGQRRHYIGGKEVSAEDYLAMTEDRDRRTLEDMFSTGIPPHGISDCTLMRDTANGKQFAAQPHVGDYYRSVADKAGVSTTGKKYLSGLAKFPGDPKAWVDSRGDIERLCEERGMGSEGTVNVKAREAAEPPKPGPEVADWIVQQEMREVLAGVPDAHMVDTEDLASQIIEKRKPKKRVKKQR